MSKKKKENLVDLNFREKNIFGEYQLKVSKGKSFTIFQQHPKYKYALNVI